MLVRILSDNAISTALLPDSHVADSRNPDQDGHNSTGKEQAMKVWITKYALTSGVIETEAEISGTTKSPKSMIVCHLGYFHKPDWHSTEVSALKRVKLMFVNRIKSLEEKIQSLRRKEQEVISQGISPITRKLEKSSWLH
jgi:hypothetical protein